MPIKPLITDLYQTDFAPVSPGADLAVSRFKEELDFKIIEIPSQTEKNGWLVPDSWSYTKAQIKLDGKVIYDGREHPLGLVGYSPTFRGKVDRETLKKHLYFSTDFDDALVFHCTHFFRPLERDWGFCVPKTFYDHLPDSIFEIDIETQQHPGTMKILEYTLKGKSEETIVLHAHNCHPGQANDDLSGCAVGIEFLKRLKNNEQNYFTYTLIISPEIFGSFYWLDQLSDNQIKNLKYGIMLKSVGNNAELKLQRSYLGDSLIDLAAQNTLQSINPGFFQGPFRRVYGNDETVFEAPGYCIPTISLTRFPFAEYHTSRDTPEIILESRLEETTNVLQEISFALETNCKTKSHFKGLLGLSHPRYNLYQPIYNPASRDGPKKIDKFDWHYLMIDMFRDFDTDITILEIAQRHGLPYKEVLSYLSKLKETGAISFIRSRSKEDI